MIYTKMTRLAAETAYRAHKDQTDKAGFPYILHPVHVAEQMKTEETTIVALLHDVIEDSSFTAEDISAMGFSDDIIEALKLLTHDKNTDYFEYVLKIKDNPIARAVKIADLTHNSDLSRLPNVTQKDILRVEKYKKAIEILNE